jgi:hydroxypyruvate isomerase
VAALRQVLATTPDDLQLVLEPLNTVLDHPGYWLSDMATAAAIVREVGSSRLKVLCDLYHMAMMGHPLERLIDAHVAHIGHVHVADVPGRHEPGTGAIDWLAVLRRLRDRGYAGNVGFEYFPAGDPEASLRAVRRLWNAL